MLVDVGIGGIEEVDQKIGDDDFFEGRLEGLDEAVGQTADETDGVGEQERAAVGQHELARRGIERREQLVCGEHLRAGEFVEEGGFAGVGVADDGGAGDGRALAFAALGGALRDDLNQLGFESRDAIAHKAAILLKLGFAFATHFAFAALTRKVGPRARQSGQGILHARQGDLQHGLAGLGAVGEDFENDFLTVDDGEAGFLFPVALLGGRKLLVDHDDIGTVFLGESDQLGGFATADQEFGLLAVAQVDQRGMMRDIEAEIFHEFLQFDQQLLAFARSHVRSLHSDEEGACGGFLRIQKVRHG